MKLMLTEYLRNMGERGGLDMLVANLLSQMGLTVLTTPIRGSKQYGVDVAAVGKLLDEDADQTIYLFSIKSVVPNGTVVEFFISISLAFNVISP